MPTSSHVDWRSSCRRGFQPCEPHTNLGRKWSWTKCRIFKYFNYLTNFMEQNPCWEANSRSGRPKIHCHLWNPKAHYLLNKRLPLVPIQSQMNAVHTLTSISLRSILVLSSHLQICLPSGLLFQVFEAKFCIYFSTFKCALHVPPISSSLIWSS
jgi:hypothetical protein